MHCATSQTALLCTFNVYARRKKLLALLKLLQSCRSYCLEILSSLSPPLKYILQLFHKLDANEVNSFSSHLKAKISWGTCENNNSIITRRLQEPVLYSRT